jgi:mono/diheme cytochrome c family protein
MQETSGNSSRRIVYWPVAVLAAALLTSPAYAEAQGYFTQQQVQQGRQVFSANCSQCHGSRLQGGAGPALKGKNFAASMKFGNYDASSLYHFISTHMPKTDPGGLSQKKYIEVFSYILSQNGFTPGNKTLDKKSIGKIKLLPLPATAKG